MRVDIKKETAIASGQRSAANSAEVTQLDRLDELESQSVFILREAFARLKRIAILWSLGKDSNVMIWLARKAFFGRVPCPAMHVDTGKKFREMYAFRDRYAKEWQLDLLVERCPAIDAIDPTLPPPRARPPARPKVSSWRSPSTASTD
jgi:sulfate adenylyltransferase subunit 2